MFITTEYVLTESWTNILLENNLTFINYHIYIKWIITSPDLTSIWCSLYLSLHNIDTIMTLSRILSLEIWELFYFRIFFWQFCCLFFFEFWLPLWYLQTLLVKCQVHDIVNAWFACLSSKDHSNETTHYKKVYFKDNSVNFINLKWFWYV
jgi:hypothetical protein